MPKQTSLYLHTGHNVGATTFVAADTTTIKTVFSGSANDSDLKTLIATSDDTAAVNLRIFMSEGSINYLLGTINIPTLSGTNGVAPSVNLLNTTFLPGLLLDASAKAYLPVKSGSFVRVAPLVTMTAAKTCSIVAMGHDY